MRRPQQVDVFKTWEGWKINLVGQKAFNVGLNDYNLHYNESREKGARTLNPQNIGFNATIIPTYRQKNYH